MSDISLNGNDTISLTLPSIGLTGYLLTKWADKDYGLLTFPNELFNFKEAKGGNAIISFANMGRLGELTLRLLAGSVDDQALNSTQQSSIGDPPSFMLISGQITKRVGDGKGNVRNILYYLQGGAFTTIPENHSNADGDEEQGIVVWKAKFARGKRQIM